MENEKTIKQDYERILIDTVRTLPQNRAEQLVDFARFLEAQILAEELIHSENLEQLEADNERWDAIFDTEASEELLEKLAKEALAEYKTEKTKPMTFNEDGQIVPE
jgi:hypothetical protein